MFHNNFYIVKHKVIIHHQQNIEGISREDKNVLKILETGAKENIEHNDVPPPFEHTNIKLPYNRNQAIRRMKQLQLWFQKELKISWRLNEAYLRTLRLRAGKKTKNKGKPRYLAFHMELEIQVNQAKESTFGIQIRNSLQGDMEAMFYEVQVSDNQRSFVRYLYRKSDNFEDAWLTIKCASISAYTSTPGFCNYAFRKQLIIHQILEQVLQKHG